MRSLGFIALLLAAGVGFFAYQRSLSGGPVGSAPPQEQIDVVGIRVALTTMGEAERRYLAAHGSYGTLDQLANAGLLEGGSERRGYTFDAVPDGTRGFSITATPAESDWPTLVITESMRVTER